MNIRENVPAELFVVEDGVLMEVRDDDQALGRVMEIPEGVTALNPYAYGDTDGVEELILPDSLTTVQEDAFTDWQDLKAVTFGKHVEEIQYRAFSNCPSLEKITVFGKAYICDRAFDQCENLQDVALEDFDGTIEIGAFQETKVKLPKHLYFYPDEG